MTDQQPEIDEDAVRAEQARLAELYTDEPGSFDEDEIDEADETDEDVAEDEDDEDEDFEELIQVTGPVDLSGRCEITLHISVSDVDNLEQAINTAAINLGRYGMDPFYVLALDPETGKRWVVNGGRVFEETDESDKPEG